MSAPEPTPIRDDLAPPGPPAPPAPPAGGEVASSRKSAEERREMLARTLQGQIAQGARVESQSDFQAVLVKGKPVNHVLHLILGLVTLSLWWLFVWLPLGIFGGEKRSMVNVDEFGNVSVQKV